MKENTLNRIKKYFEDKPVIAVYLYGSVLESKLNSLSDIDIGVLLTDEVLKEDYLDRRLHYIVDLGKLFKGKRADVVVLNQTSPLLAHQIVTTGKPIYVTDQFEKTRFEVEAIKRYDDAKFLRDVYYSYLEKRIRDNKMGEKYEK